MDKKKRKGRITRTRNRYAKEVSRAWRMNQKCYAIFRVIDGPSHAEIREDWSEQCADHRSVLLETFKAVNVEDELIMRSERHGCIAKANAILPKGGTLPCLPEILEFVTPVESHLWHFAGGLAPSGLTNSRRIAFCEYDAKTRKGFIIIVFDGELLPAFLKTFPHSLQDVRAFRSDGCDWLCANW